MFNELRFALYAIRKNIEGSAELRVSFLMHILGMVLNNTSFIVIWVFFVHSVGIIGGWTAWDVVALQGFTALSYGLIFSVGVGIRKLPEYVASGIFDRFLLSPKHLLVRIATASFNPAGIGDIFFGILSLLFYGFFTHISFVQTLLLLGFVFLSALTFLSVAIIVYSTSFFFIESQTVTNGLFELFMTPALFHGGAFQGVVRFLFTFIIPSLLIGAIPVETVKSLSLSTLWLMAGLAIFWWRVSLLIFNKAIKRYESSNLMTFGS